MFGVSTRSARAAALAAMISLSALAATNGTSHAASGTQVRLGKTPLGAVLVDGAGMSLYMFTKDSAKPSTSVCYDKCAVAWPPLYAEGALTAGPGVDQALLGTTSRKDGKLQATYNGWPPRGRSHGHRNATGDRKSTL